MSCQWTTPNLKCSSTWAISLDQWRFASFQQLIERTSRNVHNLKPTNSSATFPTQVHFGLSDYGIGLREREACLSNSSLPSAVL